jgi:LysR family transcriptional activator of nhaA
MSQTANHPWINYHHLYYFKVIAEEGSVSKAAKTLRLGQPTLSAQLKQLEESLGIKLFERSHKRLILTEQGRLALEYAKGIFRMGSEMYEAIHDRLRPTKLSLCIGSLDTIPKQITLQLVKAALKISPCQITLLEGGPAEMMSELAAHRVDLVVTNFVPTSLDAKGLFHRVVTKQKVGIFGAPKFKGLRKDFPKSLSGKQFVLPTYDSKLRYDIEHWAKSNSIELDVLVESQDISLKKLIAASGLALLPAAQHSVQKQVYNGDLVEIGEMAGMEEQLILVSAQRKIQNPLATRLLKEFQI